MVQPKGVAEINRRLEELCRRREGLYRREEFKATVKEGAPSFLVNGDLQLIIFGGKGGVGKTTSAVSTAVYLARQDTEKKILVVSTDPAHSLADSLDCPLGGEILPVKGVDNLWGLEVDAAALKEDYYQKHKEAMKKIAYRGTILDESDIDEFLELSLPGLDEMMAVIQMADVLKEGLFDFIIMDTAPTGHTLRLLATPAKMHRWGEVLDDMQAKHRYISKVFTGRYRRDDADAFTEMVRNDVDKVNALFKDKQTTEFVPVMIPEPMSIYETERLVAVLKELKIPVRNIIVNRVAMKEDCPFCQSREKDQADHLPEIEEKFGSYNLIQMPLFPHEIRGLDGLSQYADVLSGNAYRYRPTHPVGPVAEVSPTPTAKMSDLLEGDFQLLIFGGKGGVGKTFSSAATALTLARHNPNKKILIFSTDPAHSLADSFACPIGDKETQIEGNLYAIEIDADELWADFVNLYKSDVISAFDKLMKKMTKGMEGRAGGDVAFDKDVMLELIDAAPMGIDEVMALEKIINLMREKKYDLFILDTAPTGHLLRFLELPDLVRDWLKTIFRALIKYKRVMPLTYLENLNRRLIKLSNGARGIIDTLANPQTTEFVAVTIPEAMGLLEMEDLLSTLKELKVPCRHIIVNMIIPPTECGFCASKREEQQRYIQQVKDTKSSEYLITGVELFPHQIRGLNDLTKYAERIF